MSGITQMTCLNLVNIVLLVIGVANCFLTPNIAQARPNGLNIWCVYEQAPKRCVSVHELYIEFVNGFIHACDNSVGTTLQRVFPGHCVSINSLYFLVAWCRPVPGNLQVQRWVIQKHAFIRLVFVGLVWEIVVCDLWGRWNFSWRWGHLCLRGWGCMGF